VTNLSIVPWGRLCGRNTASAIQMGSRYHPLTGVAQRMLSYLLISGMGTVAKTATKGNGLRFGYD